MNDKNLIFRKTVNAAEIVEKYPPEWYDEYKKRLYEISCPEGTKHSGKIQISRWNALPLPEVVSLDGAAPEFIFRQDAFRYEDPPEENLVEWYLNFADGDLFFSYGSELMAQDEHQVAEHPILGSVREMLADLSETNRIYDPCTRDYTRSDHNPPTPILIMGAERRIAIDTSVSIEQDRPKGLYGRLFKAASWETVEKAVKKLNPPAITNILAIEAFSGGKGLYTLEQIVDIVPNRLHWFLGCTNGVGETRRRRCQYKNSYRKLGDRRLWGQ